MKSMIACSAFLLQLAAGVAVAADAPPRWITEGPYVDQLPISIELPLESVFTLQLIEVEVGGKARRFLFDTGSPSMMSSALAAELGLEAVDMRQGRDSHGAVVDTKVVQADLLLAGTTLRKVPIFVADFPKSALCLFDGVLGSEVLPLCAWQIDVPDARLRCNSDLDALQNVDQTRRQTLHTFGYPHAPILDVRFAKKATSKALFDTGSPEYLSISPADFDGAQRNKGVADTTAGTGSLGSSIGGAAAQGAQLKVQLRSFAIGDVMLGRVEAPRRETSPSLIGAAVLQHFVVTLDSRSSAAYFEPYRKGAFVRPSYGFGLAFEDGVSVSLVWEGSPAAAAGLRPGQALSSISGAPVGKSCEDIRSAMRAMSDGDRIELAWDGGGAALERE